MAMFDYFPNYVWNLSVSIAMGAAGARRDHGHVPAAAGEGQAGEDAGTADFLHEWIKVADRLVELAAEDEEKGRLFPPAPSCNEPPLIS